jgi:predicted ATPase
MTCPSPPLYGAWVDFFADDERVREVLPLPVAFARRGVLDATVHQPALFEEVRQFLAALTAEHPVVLVLEDLQWTDVASCELLRYVARDLARRRLMILVIVSEDVLDRSRPLYRLLPAIERESGAGRIAVPRLQPADLYRLVTRSYRLPTADVTRLV